MITYATKDLFIATALIAACFAITTPIEGLGPAVGSAFAILVGPFFVLARIGKYRVAWTYLCAWMAFQLVFPAIVLAVWSQFDSPRQESIEGLAFLSLLGGGPGGFAYVWYSGKNVNGVYFAAVSLVQWVAAAFLGNWMLKAADHPLMVLTWLVVGTIVIAIFSGCGGILALLRYA